MHKQIRAVARDLIRLRASPARFAVAVGAGISIALPIVALTALGRPDLGLMASSGAFISLYIPYRNRYERARFLPLVALVLLAGAILLVSVAAHPTLSLWLLTCLTLAVAILGFAIRIGPPGAVFFVLVSAVSGQLAAPESVGGRGLSPALIIGMLAVGMASAYTVVVLPLVLPGVRQREHARRADRMRITFSLDQPSRIILGRIIVAVLIAAVLCVPLGVHRFYWVLLTILAILQNGPRVTLSLARGVHRITGTFLGMGLFAIVSLANPHGLWLALFVGAMQFLVELVITRNYGLGLLFVTPLAMTIASQGHVGETSSLIGARLGDTLLGTVVAFLTLVSSVFLQRYWAQGKGAFETV